MSNTLRVLRILSVFGHVSIQGPPKLGLRRFGVPPGGAFDHESFALSNALLGNDLDGVAIELAMGALKLHAIRTTRIAVVGAECGVQVDGRIPPLQSSFQVLAGQVVEIEAPTEGARSYISMLRSNPKQSDLCAGAFLLAEKCESPPSPPRTLARPPSTIGANILRVIRIADLPTQPYTVSLDSDRVGIRLDGLQLDPGEEKLSEPACPGTIQVTNDGNLIILGPDGPTIGGYRKVGVVCSADIDKLGQVRPGQQVTFQTVTQQEAIAAWRERTKMLDRRLAELNP